MEENKNNQEELVESGAAEAETPEEVTAEEEVTPAEETAAQEAVPAEEPAAEDTAPAEQASVEESSAEIKEGKKVTPGKIALAVAAVVVLIAVLVALIVSGLSGKNADDETLASGETVETAEATVGTVPPDGNPDDVTCKGTYTVTDEEAAANKAAVVATIGDKTLTNGQLQPYYWGAVNSYLSSNGSYAPYIGLDYTQPLDTQVCFEDDALTWQQYFLQAALNSWQLSQALAIESQAAGMEVSQEERDYLDNLSASLEETATYYGITVDELLLSAIGPGAGFDEYYYYQELYCQGASYYAAEVEKIVPTPEDIEAYFAEHESEYAENGITKDGKYVDVRHILVFPEGGTTDESGNTTYSDEEWEVCRVKAQEILDEWLAGDATEDSFAALANEKSEDGGSNTNGGLYENVYEGQMVEPFEDWCFDESRETGDYGLVQTTYGYHVMYYVGSTPIWQVYAENHWITEKTNEMMASLAEKNPMEVDYSAISLGYISMG